MKVHYHPSVRHDVREALAYYGEDSEQLADDFWGELLACITSVAGHPERQHFDLCGLRRCNLRRFPYHFLYRTEADHIRILVVRHDKRHPSFGTRRR